ncbi:MAG: septal ring lytic transglycosylase RlpA family protein [Spongiibacteraceae bacterium]
MKVSRVVLALVLVLLTACVAPVKNIPAESASEGDFEQDGLPSRTLLAENITSAEPRYEAIRLAGNLSPYTVMGKQYHVVDDYRGFTQRGVASWYGRKFHGRKTANGEVFDAYQMTAAHKTLPIPLYVRVRNLENGRSVIVRVNDRGPFHDNRIIDLSYAAAVKLGFADKGTAKVEIAVLDTDNGGLGSNVGGASYYLQLAAFSKRVSAETLRRKLLDTATYPVRITSSGGRAAIHRVQLGPFSNYAEAQLARNKFKKSWTGDVNLIVEDAKP